MNEFLNIQRYHNLLGHFWQNFNNLEYFLRLFLYKKNGGNNTSALSLTNLPLGSVCDENAITDYNSFGKLTEAFNNYQKKNNKIDFTDLINLRDALTHGRITQNFTKENWVVSIIKYSRPDNKKVIVEYKKDILSTDFEKMVKRTGEIAMEISRRMGSKMA